MGQRLVRAKTQDPRRRHRLRRCPEPSELPERLDAVLEAIYAAYGSGWEDAAGTDARRKGLAAEAIWLARAARHLLPDEPEARGLLALMLYCEARAPARAATPTGAFVPLAEQDPGALVARLIAEAERELAAAARPAARAASSSRPRSSRCTASAPITGRTNWEAIALLYDGLVAAGADHGRPGRPRRRPRRGARPRCRARRPGRAAPG